MAISKRTLNDALRIKYLERIISNFIETEDVLRVASGEVAIPCVDSEGNDSWVTIAVKVPTGSHDGDPYDGYALAEEYTLKQAEKEEKAKESAAKKAAKIAKDKADREAKAAAKAKAQAEKERG